MDNLPPAAGANAGAVRLLARWTLADAVGGQAPWLADERITQPWDGSADGLAVAQRAALWTLAQHIAAGPQPAPPGSR